MKWTLRETKPHPSLIKAIDLIQRLVYGRAKFLVEKFDKFDHF